MSTSQYTFICDQQQRLDLFLRDVLKRIDELTADSESLSNSKVRRLIIAGAISVNGKQIRVPSYMVFRKSEVTVSLDVQKFFYEKPAHDIHFEVTEESVLYEDEAIIVINKPAFFPVEATIVGNRDNLHDAVVRYLHRKSPSLRNPPYVGIMHRLDHETSGAILFTKQRAVNAAIHDMFELHTAQKTYCAICALTPLAKKRVDLKTFSVDNYMGRISPKSSAAKWGSVPQAKGGVHAHTDFICMQQGMYQEQSVVKVIAKPLTGRTHQIRVHASSVGLPLIGDTLYGGTKSDRILLHAQFLTFPHPVTKKELTIEAPLPSCFIID